MVRIVIITQIIKENKFSREKITETAVVKYCDTVIKEKEIAWEMAGRRTKKAERMASESEKSILFAGLVSVYSTSAFPLNSQFCGQIFWRSRASAFRTISRALQKKNPQIFVLCARKSEDFWSEWRDSNPRPLGPEPSAIPNFATPRNCLIIILAEERNVKHFFHKQSRTYFINKAGQIIINNVGHIIINKVEHISKSR